MGYKKYLQEFKSVNLQKIRPKSFLQRANKLYEDRFFNVERKNGWKQVEQCPVCGCKEFKKEFSKFKKDIVCCITCSVRYALQIPVDTNDVYSDDDYLPGSIESYMKEVAYRKQRFANERIEVILQQIGTSRNKSLLDIGCGTGWFLETARDAGFEVEGQDLGTALAEWTSNRTGVHVFNQPLSEIPLKNKFDVITMFDLIEHVPAPLQLLEDCKNLLKDNGILFVLTPNFDSLAVNIMKESSNIISPADHLVYYTKDSVKVLAEKVNMELVFYQTCGIDLGDMKSFYEWRGEHDLEKACENLFELIQPLIDASEAANHLRFILKKIKSNG